VNASVRARIASHVVEVFGSLLVLAGLIVGIWLVLNSGGRSCTKPGLTMCLVYVDTRDTFQVWTGISIIGGGLVSGALLVMLGAYVSSQVSGDVEPKTEESLA
jgi:hypothetical protein